MVKFDKCFDRESVNAIKRSVDLALLEIEKLAGRKIAFPQNISCMSESEVSRGRRIRGLGHEEGAGHGMLSCDGKCIVKVNRDMSAYNILANVVHENIHFAFPEKGEVETDSLTEFVLEKLKKRRNRSVES